MEYRAKVFEASFCDKDRNTKSIHAWPIEDGGVILMIGNFPGRNESPSFEHLNEIHGIIFLNKGHAVDLANEIIRATRSEKPDTISYDFIPETGWDVLSPGMKLLLGSVQDSGV